MHHPHGSWLLDGTATSSNTTVTIEVIAIVTQTVRHRLVSNRTRTAILSVCPALSPVLFVTLFEAICSYACRVHCLPTAVLNVPNHHHNVTGFGVIGQQILSEGGAAGNASFVCLFILIVS